MDTRLKLLALVFPLAGCVLPGRSQEERRITELEARVAALEREVADLRRENAGLRDLSGLAGELFHSPRLAQPTSPSGPAPRCTGSGNRYQLHASDRERVYSSDHSLVTEVRIVPFFEQGKAKGFKIYGVRPDSLVSSCGLQNGDVVARVNGVEIASPEQALTAYNDARQADKVELGLVRSGVPVTVRIDVTP